LAEPFYTVGHSTLSIEGFVEALKSVGVVLVVDVRTMPRSRTNPQFNRDTLPDSLAGFGIGYAHIAALGGLGGKNRDVLPNVNAFWRNDSFHNYADYAMGEPFVSGFARLRELGHEQRCAVMCAEAVWWRCHRRIIADYLVAAGETVFHIIGASVEPAGLTGAARVMDLGVLTYPASSDS
jgi:uncharacterized protein (DUF488 family)